MKTKNTGGAPKNWGNQRWNDAGTYNAQTDTGGANGSIRHWRELKLDAYSEMGKALFICEEVKKACPRLTYADIIQIGGCSAVHAACGVSVVFEPGRKDSSGSPEEADFPDANLIPGLQHKLITFRRMGLTDNKEIVALIGGLTMGRLYKASLEAENTKYVAPVELDNSYFVDLVRCEKGDWYIEPEDKLLLDNSEFRPYVEKYAEDQQVFLDDYAVVHKKISDMGFKRYAYADHKLVGFDQEKEKDHKVEGKSSTVDHDVEGSDKEEEDHKVEDKSTTTDHEVEGKNVEGSDKKEEEEHKVEDKSSTNDHEVESKSSTDDHNVEGSVKEEEEEHKVEDKSSTNDDEVDSKSSTDDHNVEGSDKEEEEEEDHKVEDKSSTTGHEVEGKSSTSDHNVEGSDKKEEDHKVEDKSSTSDHKVQGSDQ